MAKLPGDKMKDLNEVGIAGYGLKAEIKPEFLIAQTKQSFHLGKTLMQIECRLARVHSGIRPDLRYDKFEIYI